jgi:phenylpropionate dioxygenase-like ring-hydroxylating dioxygenase large terminal subunit
MPTHASYVEILSKRNAAKPGDTAFRRTYSARNPHRGTFTFERGHNMIWLATDEPELRALWQERDKVTKRVDETRFKWMLYTRNLLVFPNFQLLETESLQIRVNRPLAADKTEITTYCVVAKGESQQARRLRIRQYEEFYNPTGLATPDDMAVFDALQTGQATEWVDWHQGYMRGLATVKRGADAHAQEIGINPVTSMSTTTGLGDETVFHSQYLEWRRLLKKGLGYTEEPRELVRGAAE